MVITDDYRVASPILETSSYYPFGLMQKGISNANSVLHQQNKYLYNGKELQQKFGLDQYDYGARFYDPQIGVWHTQDPLTETSRRWTPYNYAYDNPIRFIDKDGMRVDTVIQRETILQFENPRFNGAFFYRYDRFINSIIANQSDADIDGDGSNSTEAKKDKTHQNTNAAGIDRDEVNGYVLPTSDYRVEKDGRSRKGKESTEIGKANRKAFSNNGVRHKDVPIMYNLDNEKPHLVSTSKVVQIINLEKLHLPLPGNWTSQMIRILGGRLKISY
ncbi:MAG TPA: RHS repeat-associated core domain-containing protein [Arachidicoccus sp.]|nr:RHS repeat-associated core domain-containing protein [Arachidicoccus sp.]